MSKHSISIDALWNDFCLWTDNASIDTIKEVNLSPTECCGEYRHKGPIGCYGCKLEEYGYKCIDLGDETPWRDANNNLQDYYKYKTKNDFDAFIQSSIDMAILTLLIYYSECDQTVCGSWISTGYNKALPYYRKNYVYSGGRLYKVYIDVAASFYDIDKNIYISTSRYNIETFIESLDRNSKKISPEDLKRKCESKLLGINFSLGANHWGENTVSMAIYHSSPALYYECLCSLLGGEPAVHAGTLTTYYDTIEEAIDAFIEEVKDFLNQQKEKE